MLYRLYQLTVRLDVEQKVRAGTDKMLSAPDLSSALEQELRQKLAETGAKISLLTKAKSQ